MYAGISRQKTAQGRIVIHPAIMKWRAIIGAILASTGYHHYLNMIIQVHTFHEGLSAREARMSDAVGRARPRAACRDGEPPTDAASFGTENWSEGLRPGSITAAMSLDAPLPSVYNAVSLNVAVGLLSGLPLSASQQLNAGE